MKARFRSWWQQLRQRRVAIAIITAIIVVAVALIIVGYQFDVTGFNRYTQVSTIRSLSGPLAGTVTRTEAYQPGKTLWDWLQLLIIPLVLAIAALLFNRATTRTEHKIAAERYKQDKEIASRHYHQDQQIAKQRYEQDRHIALDKQREDLLQTYLDRMSELLLKEKLRSSAVDAEVRNVARVRTITILFQLDARRIGYVFAFLRESGLMSTKPNGSIVNLDQADLKRINFSQADLSGADLSGARLSEADLSGARLRNANLSGAIPGEADLGEADLGYANLSGAIVTSEQLETAKSLQGATMPDGSIHL